MEKFLGYPLHKPFDRTIARQLEADAVLILHHTQDLEHFDDDDGELGLGQFGKDQFDTGIPYGLHTGVAPWGSFQASVDENALVADCDPTTAPAALGLVLPLNR